MKINYDDAFNPDHFESPVIGIAANLVGVHDSGHHSHLRHQLLFSAIGGITLEIGRDLYLLPPGRAAWIPAGTVHRATMRGNMSYRSLYFNDMSMVSKLPLKIINVNPLLFQVIERMAFWPFDMPVENQKNLLNVLCEELISSRNEDWKLTFPSDTRLDAWLNEVRNGQLPPRLNELSNKIGACQRTISRIFIRDTGMNYQTWRQQWRMLKATEMLAVGEKVSTVAQKLDFTSDSAFITFFRKHTGSTPKKY